MSAVCARQALTVAERLLKPDDVIAAVPARAAGSLAHGLAGTALLHARLSAADPVFARAAAAHWSRAAVQAKQAGNDGPGTYHSPGGLAASLIIGTRYLPDPQSYHDAPAHAARWLSARALDLAGQHRGYLADGRVGTPWRVYDAITGLAGIGRVLLAAVQSGHDAEPGLLAALGTLTAMARTRHGARPGWWTPADQHAGNTQPDPSGMAATGMAHGIAGPLAFLSLAHLAGYSVAGQDTAITEAARWLLRWRTAGTGTWPPSVTGTELDTGAAVPAAGRRDAWCYGTPGIGRSIALAGQATGDPVLTGAASAAITSLAARPAGQWDVEGPALCHGYAGVLQSTSAAQAAQAVTTLFDPGQRFGFRHVADQAATDEPGFLVGAAGIALALADHGDLPAREVPARWDALLLLS
ncbi:MAG: lanthionine synthetase C family protein [Streptosporangiaceae bacterium]